jgi:hypothetical protein
MTGLQSGEEPQSPFREQGTLSSARRNIQERLSPRAILVILALALTFFVSVGLVLYFKPGSTAEPSGEPSLDVFAAGPLLDFEPGTMTLFTKEHFFLVRLAGGASGDVTALKCRAVIRDDAQMVSWLAAAGAPQGFADRGIWDECSGVAWDATGRQVYGPESGALDRFPVEVTEGIMRVNLGDRECMNPVTPETPCIETQ